MSNLPGAPGQGNGNGNGNGTTLGTSRPVASSTASPRIRKPTDVMRDRNAREEARRVRQQGASPGPENTSSSRARQDSDPRATAARRLESAGVGASMRDSGYRSAGVSAGGTTPAEPAYATPSMQGVAPQPRQRERGASGYGASQNVPSPYESTEVPPARNLQHPIRTRPVVQESVPPRMSSSAQQQPQPRQQSAAAATQARQSQTTSQSRTSGSTARAQSGQTAAGTESAQLRNSNVSTFPHAFERWETLSSRWEGLTSYWIRKLENNPQKADINQEMARQITDLAAAGANLFHAVVELQRLRASSERKFQRWFYETRAQQEQSQEDQARLQQTLNQERAARDQDRLDRDEEVREQQTARNHERLLQEYKRELQIAKDEAKRAWEELGRREQAERERIFSLREGHTIDIGGVQVVPHGAPSRGGSQRSGQPEAYSTQQTGRSTTQGGEQEYPPPSPTDTDPFSSGARAAPNVPRPAGSSSYSQPPPASNSMSMQANPTVSAAAPPLESPSARFYTHHGTALHGASGHPQAYAGSDQESDIDYEVDETGHIRHDSTGQPIIRYRAGDPVVTGGTGVLPGPAPTSRHRHHDSMTGEDLEVESLARERMRAEQHGRSQSSGQMPQIHTVPPARSAAIEQQSPTHEHGGGEYEGRDYPEDELEWAELQQQRQHHHPTRLSDVPEEEDERSRGSMSRPSRGSEGMF